MEACGFPPPGCRGRDRREMTVQGQLEGRRRSCYFEAPRRLHRSVAARPSHWRMGGRLATTACGVTSQSGAEGALPGLWLRVWEENGEERRRGVDHFGRCRRGVGQIREVLDDLRQAEQPRAGTGLVAAARIAIGEDGSARDASAPPP